MPNKVPITLYLDREIFELAKQKAEQNNRSVSGLIRGYLIKYVKEQAE